MPELPQGPVAGIGMKHWLNGPARFVVIVAAIWVGGKHLKDTLWASQGQPSHPGPSLPAALAASPSPSSVPSPSPPGIAWAFGPLAGPTMPPDGPGAIIFQAARPGHAYRFPQDHGDHPSARTEWWYLTGQAEDATKGRFGYELTFFKTGLTPRPPRASQSRWRSERVWLAHLALTDPQGKRFFVRERTARAGSGLAGASPLGLDVRLGGWRFGPEAGGLRAKASEGDLGLDLLVTPTRGPVVNGVDGLSRKGPEPGAASHYVSWPQLKAEGALRLPGLGALQVKGEAWMDHEWGSALWPKDLAGWDWSGLNFDDGSALMTYQLRDATKGLRAESAGTWMPAGAAPEHLDAQGYVWKATGSWTSPHTGATYPMGWTLSLPKQGLELRLTPLLEDQELQTDASTRVTYWEGAVEVSGSLKGKAMHGRGYVELTGYTGRGGPGT